MTNEVSIIDNLPAPEVSLFGDALARWLKGIKNLSMSFVADPHDRAGLKYYPADEVESGLFAVIAGLPGAAGDHLRAYCHLDSDDERMGTVSVVGIDENALEAAAGYAVVEVEIAKDHKRPVSPDDIWAPNRLEAIIASLREKGVILQRWDLEQAARYVGVQLVQGMET